MPSLPPGPSRRVPGALALAFTRDRLAFLRTVTRQYGDAVYFTIGSAAFAVLNHPDYVRDVLVTQHARFHKGVGLERAKVLLGEGLLTSEDAFHARQRRLLVPAFHRERVTHYARVMAEYTQRLRSEWRDGRSIDVSHEMAALTLAIAGKTLFDANIEDETTDIRAALADTLSSFNITMLPFGDKLVHLPLPPAWRFKRARARLDEIIYRLIAQRHMTGATGSDLLSMMVAARDDDGDHTGMTDEQIRDEALTLLLAGHETTANALSWTWYLLSLHAEVESRLHAEIDDVLQGQAPAAADIPRLVYARAVITEAMRLFPPAYILGRRTLEPYRIPQTDFELPRGTVVLISQYLLHRDPRFWERPEEFSPERWLDVNTRPERQRYSYFPFGAGPRICIGEHFAWMEAMVVLATLAQQWRLRLVPGQRIEPDPSVTLRVKHGIRMQVERRHVS